MNVNCICIKQNEWEMGVSVLILGGYGIIGSMIARFLIEKSDVHVIVAGRRYTQAQKKADEFGEQVTACEIIVSTEQDYDAALQDVDIVVVCFDLPDDRFPRACLERGIDYVDISAESQVLSRIGALDNLAREHNATALISVGLMPGISNLMAKRGVEQLGEVQRIDNVALLGLGEVFGSASANWTISHYGDLYDVNRIQINMGEDFGMRTAYRFAFADQYVIRKTLQVGEAFSWGCYDRILSTHLIGLIRALRLGWLFRNSVFRNWVVSAIQKFSFGSDVFVLTSRVTDEQSDLPYQSWLKGNGEAEITALIAAETIQKLFHNKFPTGVYHSEQLFDLSDFLPVLEKHEVEFQETT